MFCLASRTREIALMIQLEQQKHREFWLGGVGWVGHIPTTYIQLAGAGSTREIALMIQLEQQQHGEFWVGE